MESEWGVSLTQAGKKWLETETQQGSGEKSLNFDRVRGYLLDIDFRLMPASTFDGVKFPDTPGSKMIFQLVKIADISKPVGPEDDTEAEDGFEEIPQRKGPKRYTGGKRLLRLNLVGLSGEIKVEALEVCRIEALTEDLVPGTKILLNGPISIVAGFAILEAKNSVSVLGGGVKRLAEGWKFNREVKARRGDLSSADPFPVTSDGPPRFISFLDIQKGNPKKDFSNKKDSSPSKLKVEDPKEENDRPARVVESLGRSDKLKELQSAKLGSDAFAMRSKGSGRAPRDRNQRRRENDELIEMFRPPSYHAPKLAAFVRLDKCTSLQEAQMLSDAMAEQLKHEDVPDDPNRKGGKGYTRQREFNGRSKGSGPGKGKGKGRR